MPIITIDSKDYDLEGRSYDDAKEQLTGLQFVDSELERKNAEIAVLLIARAAYSKALQQILPAFVGDTMKFN